MARLREHQIGTELHVPIGLDFTPTGVDKALAALEKVKGAAKRAETLRTTVVADAQGALAKSKLPTAQKIAALEAFTAGFESAVVKQFKSAGAAVFAEPAKAAAKAQRFPVHGRRGDPGSVLGLGSAFRAAQGAVALAFIGKFASMTLKASKHWGAIKKTTDGMKKSLSKALQPMGDALATILLPAMKAVTAISDKFNSMPAALKTIVGYAAAITVAVVAMATLVKLTKELMIIERALAIWQGIRRSMQFIVGLLNKQKAIELALIAIETVRALIAAAYAAFVGNIPGLIVGGALLAAAGVAGFIGYKALSGGGRPAERPQRRSSWEHVFQREFGRVWSG